MLVEATYKETKYISSSPLDVDEVLAILTNLKQRAERDGYSKCKVVLESTLEAYEDYPGDVAVSIVGLREETKQEEKARKEQELTAALAKRKGITFFEASQLKHLIKLGVVKDEQ